jgi:uncharacterized protein YpiB (UPF0302 family)
MKNEKLPSEEVVTSYSVKKKKSDASLQDMFIEMIIHESLLVNKKRNLEKKINLALDEKNKPLFLTLSGEMNDLLKMFG